MNITAKKMIEANTPLNPEVEKKSKTDITISGILEDLENGLSREQIGEKYSIQGWEVTALFKHPKLQGKRAKKKRELSFNIVDDTETMTDPAAEQITEAVSDNIAEDLTDANAEEVEMEENTNTLIND